MPRKCKRGTSKKKSVNAERYHIEGLLKDLVKEDYPSANQSLRKTIELKLKKRIQKEFEGE
jgi:hypothetical protein